MKAHYVWHKPAYFVIAGLIFLSLGCLPKRVYWSPDGKKAVILAGNGHAYVTDAKGKLSSPAEMNVVQVAWLPDSQQVVAVMQEQVANWQQATRYLSESRQKELIQLTPHLRAEILQHQGTFNDWRPAMAENLTSGELGALWLYVREHQPEGLAAKLGTEAKPLFEAALTAHILRLCTVGTEGLKPGDEIFSSLNVINSESLRVSPDGRKLAWTMEYFPPPESSYSHPSMGIFCEKCADKPGGKLVTCELKPHAEILVVAGSVAPRTDWTADSQCLVYAACDLMKVQENTVILGSIVRRRICDQQGRLLSTFRDPEHMAGIVFFPDTKVVCLKDGRILFSALLVQLPSTQADMPQKATLFAIDPDKQSTVTRMVAQDVMNQSLDDAFMRGWFDISPDGRAVTMLNLERGRVEIYTFAGSKLEPTVPPSTQKEKLLDRPTWRNNQELSMLVPAGHPDGSANRPELVIYSIESKKARCISKTWPDDLMKTFLPDYKPSQTQPAASEPAK